MIQCYRYYEATGHPELAASALEELTLIDLRNLEPEAALEWCNKGLEFIYQAEDVSQLARLLKLKVQILTVLGHINEAEALAPLSRYLLQGHKKDPS